MARTVAIIGAGMAGLAAARALTQAGVSVTIYEKSRSVGGRVATRRVEGCILDHGAQNVKPGAFALARVMQEELPSDALVRIDAPVRVYQNDGTIRSPDPEYEAEAKFTYRNGLTTLPKLLAQSLPPELAAIHFETRVGRLEGDARGIVLYDERDGETGQADRVIVTAPAPQAAELLAASRLRDDAPPASRIEALRAVPYGACLTVLLGYAPPMPAPPAYALLAEDRSRPLLWAAFERTKAPERAPNGQALVIAQLGPAFSAEQYAAPDAAIVAATLEELRLLFGAEYDQPAWSQVKRWRYSQPRGMADFNVANPPGASVVVCGDALRPENGRVYQAYESGLEAAARLHLEQ